MRRLPVILEQFVAQVAARKISLEQDFRTKLYLQLSESHQEVSCRRGCHFCCFYPVTIGILEGIRIFLWLEHEGLWTQVLKEKVKEYSAQTWNLALEIWFLSTIPCPLLDGTECMAYKARPLVCRLTYSVADPSSCHPHRLGNPTGFVERRSEIEQFAQEQTDLSRKRRHRMGLLPLATAILYAERVCKGELDLSEVDRALLEEHREKG